MANRTYISTGTNDITTDAAGWNGGTLPGPGDNWTISCPAGNPYVGNSFTAASLTIAAGSNPLSCSVAGVTINAPLTNISGGDGLHISAGGITLNGNKVNASTFNAVLFLGDAGGAATTLNGDLSETGGGAVITLAANPTEPMIVNGNISSTSPLSGAAIYVQGAVDASYLTVLKLNVPTIYAANSGIGLQLAGGSTTIVELVSHTIITTDANDSTGINNLMTLWTLAGVDTTGVQSGSTGVDNSDGEPWYDSSASVLGENDAIGQRYIVPQPNKVLSSISASGLSAGEYWDGSLTGTASGGGGLSIQTGGVAL